MSSSKNHASLALSLLTITVILASCDKKIEQSYTEIASITPLCNESPVIDYSNCFSLNEVGDYAIVADGRQYLLLQLQAIGSDPSAKVRWWYQEGKQTVFNVEEAESGSVNLFEKYKEIKNEGDDYETINDEGSQLYIHVKDLCVEWSAGQYFYVPQTYQYKVFDKRTEIEKLQLMDIRWEKGDSTTKDCAVQK